jgi:hypothetical protein
MLVRLHAVQMSNAMRLTLTVSLSATCTQTPITWAVVTLALVFLNTVETEFAEAAKIVLTRDEEHSLLVDDWLQIPTMSVAAELPVWPTIHVKPMISTP